jgi:CRP/FNR family transcriptional regulator, cyclic AMP receptor protein
VDVSAHGPVHRGPRIVPALGRTLDPAGKPVPPTPGQDTLDQLIATMLDPSPDTIAVGPTALPLAPVRANGIWARLDDDDRSDLAVLGRPRRYPSGGVLFAQGEQSNHVLLLTGGRVKVFCTTEDGREPVLGLRGEGELVGELAAIDDHSGGRTSTVVAMEPVTAQEISGPEFRAYLAAHPSAAMELLRMVVGRLRSADRRRIEFGGFETTSRLAHLLAELADEDGDSTAENGIDIPFSQDELAAMVGASRESVARALARLRASGLVESRRRGVALIDVAALRRHGL